MGECKVQPHLSNLQRTGWRRQRQILRSTKCGFLKRRTESTSVFSYLDIYSVTIAKISKNSIFVLIDIGLSKQTVETLIDCGAGGLFIDKNFARKFKVKNLEQLIKAFNVDGTKNKKGMTKSYVDLEF